MAIAYRSSVYDEAATPSITISKPAGTMYGDVMLAFVWGRGGNPLTIATPTGWTEIATQANSARFSIFWRRVEVHESVEYTFVSDHTPLGPVRLQGFITSLSGCVLSGDPIDTYSNTAYVVDDENIVAAEVTTSSADEMLVFAGAGFSPNDFTGTAALAGMDERLDEQDSGDSYQTYLATAAQAVAGVSGAKTCVVDAADTFQTKHAFLVALIPAPDGPVVSLVYPTDGGIVEGPNPALTFGTANADSADVHVTLKVSLFADFRTLVFDTDSSTDYADWLEAADPFTTWTAITSGGATAGNRVQYPVTTALRYDTYYALVWLEDSSHVGQPVIFDFVVSPDSSAALSVTIGGTAFDVGVCTITEETGGNVSTINLEIPLAAYLAHPLSVGDTIAVSSGIGGHSRVWNGTLETWTFSGSVVSIYGVQDDAYLSRKLATGDEASDDVGQNLADLVTSYGSPLSGANIDTATGITAAITGGYKYLREHFIDAMKSLPGYVLWVDESGDIHFVDQDDMDVSSYIIYEADPSGATPLLWCESRPDGDSDYTWRCASSSSSGAVLHAGRVGHLYRSTDNGATWTELIPVVGVEPYWKECPCSDDGEVILAGAISTHGSLHLSTNGGDTWTEQQPAGAVTADWEACAVDADGSVMLAGVDGGRLYKSVNSGASWSEVQPAGDADKDWNTCAVDADGSVMLAGIYVGRLWLSSDTGANWSEVRPAGDADVTWRVCATDADGSTLLAGAETRLYLSVDTGANWSEVRPAGDADRYWYGAALSDDGTVMVACCSTNVDAATGVYMSVDSGVTWTEGLTLASASADWYACAVNSDGTQAIAVVTAGRVYMGTVEPTDYHVHLLPDTTIEMSTLQTANKVYCVIDGVAGVSTATNTTVAPTYASSPREILIVIKGGSTSTVAAAQLAFLQIERYKLDGLPVSLRQGLGIQRGYRQWVVSPRAGVELCLPVRRVQHDFGSNVTTVDLGEFAGARDDMGALLEIAKRLDQLAKEAAI